jgi:hypothetical protein
MGLAVDQIPGVTPTDDPAQAQDNGQPPADLAAAPQQSGFGSRGRVRRRARFLRKARELAYRDLGGLVFNLHRFGSRNDALVLAKLTTVGKIDAELRTLEATLGEHEAVTVLREAGINACPRCAAIHSSEDRFCPNCGLSMGRHVDLPIAGAAAPAGAPTVPSAAPAAPAPAPAASTSTPAASTPAPPTPAPPAPTPAPASTEPAAPATPAPAPPVTPTAAPAPARPTADSSDADTAPAAHAPPTADSSDADTAPAAHAPPTADAADAEQPTEILHPEQPQS